MKKAFFLWVSAAVFVPLIIYLALITPSSIGIIKKGDAGSWMGFYGSIIGGVMTLIGVRWTIRDQNEKRKEDMQLQELRMRAEIDLIEKRRKEDQRLSFAPFFSYSTNEASKMDKIIPIPSDFLWLSGVSPELENSMIGLSANIFLRNIGAGVAINPRILTVEHINSKYNFSPDSCINVNINETAKISLNFKLPELSQLRDATLILGYYNILQDFYQQTITIEFVVSTTIELYPPRVKNECHEIRIKDVQKAVLTIPSKDMSAN